VSSRKASLISCRAAISEHSTSLDERQPSNNAMLRSLVRGREAVAKEVVFFAPSGLLLIPG